MTRTMARQRIKGVPLEGHTYAGADDPYLAEGTLVGVRLDGPTAETSILIGADSYDPDERVVAAWQIAVQPYGWVAGPTWASAELAVKAARDPATLVTLREYAAARHHEWKARRQARELALRADRLMNDLLAVPCAGAGRRTRHVQAGKGGRETAKRNRQVTVSCPVCPYAILLNTDQNGWTVVPRHANPSEE